MKLKYIDNKSRTWVEGQLQYYLKGVTPHRGDEIKVTENEAKALLKMKNGENPVFEKITPTRSEKAPVFEENQEQ